MDARFSSWVKRIKDTQADEIDCSACLDQISRYVDLELAGAQAEKRMPQVRQHLEQCRVCSEEHQVLLAMARLDREGGLPSTGQLIERLKKPPE